MSFGVYTNSSALGFCLLKTHPGLSGCRSTTGPPTMISYCQTCSLQHWCHLSISISTHQFNSRYPPASPLFWTIFLSRQSFKSLPLEPGAVFRGARQYLYHARQVLVKKLIENTQLLQIDRCSMVYSTDGRKLPNQSCRRFIYANLSHVFSGFWFNISGDETHHLECLKSSLKWALPMTLFRRDSHKVEVKNISFHGFSKVCKA